MDPKDFPAFPIPDFVFPNGMVQPGNNGMTMRDYFAAQALSSFDKLNNPNNYAINYRWTEETIAKACYGIADAMLEARKGG